MSHTNAFGLFRLGLKFGCFFYPIEDEEIKIMFLHKSFTKIFLLLQVFTRFCAMIIRSGCNKEFCRNKDTHFHIDKNVHKSRELFCVANIHDWK
jgi:hypothetical protein